MQIRSILFWLSVILPWCCAAQSVNQDTNNVTLIIHPVFNGQPLILSSQYYISPHGDTLYIDQFRFYITNLSIDNNRNSSHLIDADDSSTETFTIKSVKPGNYNNITFLLGVDSIANISGANEGDLDPAKGMYWAWNSGYIMSKLEGHSSVCPTIHNSFEFHIGGYQAPYNAVRRVTLQLPAPLHIATGSRPVIDINVDVAAYFASGLDLSKTNSILIPGRDACLIADKQAYMFSIKAVKQ